MKDDVTKPLPIQHYSKLPVVISAIQWDGTLAGVRGIEKAFPEMHTARLSSYPPADMVSAWAISTLEGTSYDVSKGDWIIRGIKGEFYPCKPDVFEKTYREERGYPYNLPENGNAIASESGRPAEDGLAREPVSYRYKLQQETYWQHGEGLPSDDFVDFCRRSTRSLELLYRSPPLEPFERLVSELEKLEAEFTHTGRSATSYEEGFHDGQNQCADRIAELLKSARGTKT